VYSDSLKKALFSPLAQQAPAGFLFWGPEIKEAASWRSTFRKAAGWCRPSSRTSAPGDVLMLGFMNPESLAETQRTGEVVFFSRSRNKLWKKGESSGHVLKVREMRVDCDAMRSSCTSKRLGLALS